MYTVVMDPMELPSCSI